MSHSSTSTSEMSSASSTEALNIPPLNTVPPSQTEGKPGCSTSHPYERSSEYVNRTMDDMVQNILSKNLPVRGITIPLRSKVDHAAEPSKTSQEKKSPEIINLDDDSSDDNKTADAGPSIASRVKSQKGKTEKQNAEAARKRKAREEPEPDVEGDVQDISNAKKPSTVPMDSAPSQSVKTASRWECVRQRRIALERELSAEAQQLTEVMQLIKKAGLEKTVVGLSNCYNRLVQEFIANIPVEISDPHNRLQYMVCVRGSWFVFSPSIINDFLGREDSGSCELEVTDKIICKVITSNKVKDWPYREKLSAGQLTVKYAVLNRIGAANWVPTHHTSSISLGLGRFIYAVGTGLKIDFGKYIFNETIKHAATNATKLPIAFPSLICGIMMSQHPEVLAAHEAPARREAELTFHQKLFEGEHKADLNLKSAATKEEVLAELQETCEKIRALTEKKSRLEETLQKMEKDSGKKPEGSGFTPSEEEE